MTRLMKVLCLVSLASGYLMQVACTFGANAEGRTDGFSIIPNLSGDGIISYLVGLAT